MFAYWDGSSGHRYLWWLALRWRMLQDTDVAVRGCSRKASWEAHTLHVSVPPVLSPLWLAC